jgi:hypothetical protein
MRDEVLAKWETDAEVALHVHSHVSRGLVFGRSKWRDAILRYHLPMALEAFWYGDRQLVGNFSRLAAANVMVHFHAREKKWNKSQIIVCPRISCSHLSYSWNLSYPR